MSLNSDNVTLPEFVSRQVSEARRFFLNLAPDHDASLEVVCGGVERMRHDYVVDRQDFPYFAVELVAEGIGRLVINGEEHPLSAGSVFAYGPRTPHTILNQDEQGMRKYYLDFVGTKGTQRLCSSGLQTPEGHFNPLTIGRLHELTDVFEMLIRDGSDNHTMVSSVCESLTELLFLKIAQLRLPTGSDLPKAYATYERVRRYIEDRAFHLHSAQDVAEECDITPVYLSRLFRRFSDCGAYEFLMRRKMSFAAGLLMNEGLMVKEVAKRLGYADPFRFSRAFKRVYGVPPTKISSAN